MTIAALPSSTLELLQSAVNVPDPVVLVKDLLDNSIDSNATYIQIILSANVVDKIEVRDNGHGIHPDDFSSIGRPGHTSKLCTFDELKNLGGSSLGFRGMALASANSVADITVTSRTAGATTATMGTMDDGGGVSKQKPKPGPIGTTVTVTNIFTPTPVRRSIYERTSKKILAQIKSLLQSYALACLTIKLSFDVLGDPKQNWSYAARPTTDLKEAVTLICGPGMSSELIFKQVPDPSIAVRGDGGARFTFKACMPRLAANSSTVSKDTFVSVDSRPMSSSGTTAKKLLSIFRETIKRTSGAMDNNTAKHMFLRLDIRCRPDSYDVNVEPAKNDVLFTCEQTLLQEFRTFLDEAYGVSSEGKLDDERGLTSATAVTLSPAETIGSQSEAGVVVQSKLPPEWSVAYETSSVDGLQDKNLAAFSTVDQWLSSEPMIDSTMIETSHGKTAPECAEQEPDDTLLESSINLIHWDSHDPSATSTESVKHDSLSDVLATTNPWTIMSRNHRGPRSESHEEVNPTYSPRQRRHHNAETSSLRQSTIADGPTDSELSRMTLDLVRPQQIGGPNRKATRPLTLERAKQRSRCLQTRSVQFSHSGTIAHEAGLLSPPSSSPNRNGQHLAPLRDHGLPRAEKGRLEAINSSSIQGRLRQRRGNRIDGQRPSQSNPEQEQTKQRVTFQERRQLELTSTHRAESARGEDNCGGIRSSRPPNPQEPHFFNYLDIEGLKGFSRSNTRADLVSDAQTVDTLLERTPREHETRNLLLTMSISPTELYDSIDNAYQYDLFVSDGRLEKGLRMKLDHRAFIESRVRALVELQRNDMQA